MTVVNFKPALAVDNTGARRSRNKKNAMQFAQVGLYVFPSDGKVPLVPRYNRADTSLTKADVEAAVEEFIEKHEVGPVHVGATRDIETIKRMWRKFPDAVPSISCGPSRLVVLDADAKDDGPAKMAELFHGIGGVPEGVPVNPTKSGGAHYVFADPEGKFTNKAGLLKKQYGTDVRGQGGQFVGPGSIREDGKTYGSDADRLNFLRAIARGKIPQLPVEIVELIGTAAADPDNESVTPSQEREVIKSLRDAERDQYANEFDPTVGKYDLEKLKAENEDFAKLYDEPGSDCSTNRFLAARHVMREWPDMPAPALAAFFSQWDGAGEYTDDKPRGGQYDDRQIAREWIKNQGLTKQSKPSDGAAFEAVDEREGAARSHTRASDLVANYRPVRWLVKRLIPLNSVGALYGLPNVGKSFVVFDLASHARRGREWFGRKVQGGDVLYCYAEGAEGMSGRAKAWADSNDTSGGDLAMMNDVPNLFRDSKAAHKLITAARECEADSGQPVRLIIVDTLAAATTGADGSSDKDMGLVCQRLRKVATELDCAVLVVHHSGKDVAKGMRGSSAILGAVDYTLLAEEKDGASLLRVEKMRDASKSQAIRFKLVEVVIGKDDDGEDETSCVIRPVVVGGSVDMTVTDEDEAPLIRRSDGREDRVEMLIEAMRAEADRADRAEDEGVEAIGFRLTDLARLLNASRANLATLDGKPMGPVHTKGVSRVIETAVQAQRLSVRGRMYFLK